MKSCEICPYKGPSNSRVDKHNFAKHFRCRKCNVMFDTKLEIIKHRENTHNVDFCCDICGKKFLRKEHVKLHSKQHEKIEERKQPNKVYVCDICDFPTSGQNHLDEHKSAIHLKNTLFLCSYCDFKSTWQSGLRRHISLKHVSDEEKPFKCDMCDFKTIAIGPLKGHKALKHAIKGFIKCRFCEFQATTVTGLTRHVLHWHKINNKQFCCNYCDFFYTYT